ncbi:MAG TPA: S53 family peptidase, partial [Terriglobia bacterium]|nr:S53 family peptidase [Terriglobia bacterium]
QVQQVLQEEQLAHPTAVVEMHHVRDLLIPDTTLERPRDFGRGLHAHTNHLMLAMPVSEPAEPAAKASTVSYETPASIHSVYNLPSTGGGGMIAVVTAYDYPTAENDLAVFSSTYHLPACTSTNGCFRKVYASGKKPAANGGWAQEAALDIEWAHAMAPNARIVLVEAASNSSTDLLPAIDVASSLVSPKAGGFGQVSMSWGFSEFSGETRWDSHFQTRGVVYFASSGDAGGQRTYPCTSPYVVCAGGTSIHRDSSGNFVSETAWSGSGGGPSPYEPRPSYQNSIVSIVGTRRGVPDVSFDADPHSGVIVYDSTPYGGVSGLLIFGGTSVSAPAVAGIVNLAGHFYNSSAIESSTLYSNSGTRNFRDIASGSAGSYTAKPGWDFVTGIGSCLGVVGK